MEPENKKRSLWVDARPGPVDDVKCHVQKATNGHKLSCDDTAYYKCTVYNLYAVIWVFKSLYFGRCFEKHGWPKTWFNMWTKGLNMKKKMYVFQKYWLSLHCLWSIMYFLSLHSFLGFLHRCLYRSSVITSVYRLYIVTCSQSDCAGGGTSRQAAVSVKSCCCSFHRLLVQEDAIYD